MNPAPPVTISLIHTPLGREHGEVEPEGLSGNLVVQLGSATEGLNRFVHSHKRP